MAFIRAGEVGLLDWLHWKGPAVRNDQGASIEAKLILTNMVEEHRLGWVLAILFLCPEKSGMPFKTLEFPEKAADLNFLKSALSHMVDVFQENSEWKVSHEVPKTWSTKVGEDEVVKKSRQRFHETACIFEKLLTAISLGETYADLFCAFEKKTNPAILLKRILSQIVKKNLSPWKNLSHSMKVDFLMKGIAADLEPVVEKLLDADRNLKGEAVSSFLERGADSVRMALRTEDVIFPLLKVIRSQNDSTFEALAKLNYLESKNIVRNVEEMLIKSNRGNAPVDTFILFCDDARSHGYNPLTLFSEEVWFDIWKCMASHAGPKLNRVQKLLSHSEEISWEWLPKLKTATFIKMGPEGYSLIEKDEMDREANASTSRITRKRI